MDRWDFYKKNFLKKINKDSNFLLVSASKKEVKILQSLGYSNFSISYYDEAEKLTHKENGFELNKNLFKTDIRNMKFESRSFEYVVTSATIHHVDLPHNAVAEMYRVANKGVLIIESNDSLIMQIACKLMLTEEFEISSVDKEKKSGGLLDTGIPNYVYRWTEREILKLLKSYDPSNINHVEFSYENDLKNIRPKKNFIFNMVLEIIKISSKVFFLFFKKQQNCLSIFIDKTKTKKRWSE